MTERDQMAAEYALGLLEGEELLQARGLAANDDEFAALVAQWERRLAPLMDEIGAVEPGPEVWARIQRKMSEGDAALGAEIIQLRRRVKRWKWVSGVTAAAAALALALVVMPVMQTTTPIAPPPQAPLVASIPIADTPLRLGVTYLPDREEMLVSASGLTADGVHDHELWLVPPEGDAQSLGVVVPGEERRVNVDAALAAQIGDGSQLVLTREPLGGAVPGTAAGPVVAEGEFTAT